MSDISLLQAGILGYMVKLDDAGVRATRDHLVRFMVQVPDRMRSRDGITYHLNALVKKNYIVRPGVGYYALTPEGRNAHQAAKELMGVGL